MSVRLFVGNLTESVTEAELRALFSAVGAVSRVLLPTDRETGKPRRFAFVDFEDRSQAEEAVRRFHQSSFQGRTIAVNEARDRESRPGAEPARGPSSAPRPSPAPRPGPGGQPAWRGPAGPDPDDVVGAVGQPRRTFGPNASARDKDKQKWRVSKKERESREPPRERGGPRPVLDEELEDQEDGLDDFALWAREDGKNRDQE